MWDAIKELKKYVRDLQRGRESLPDLLIVATDGNCKGFLERKRQIEEVTKEFTRLVICAIPDPHIERWLLLDSAAFKKVLGKGCTAPIQKCERDLYVSWTMLLQMQGKKRSLMVWSMQNHSSMQWT